MLSIKATSAYAVAWILSGSSIYYGIEAVRKPWLVNGDGDQITLWSYQRNGSLFEFPAISICYSNTGFCARWKTSTFLFTVSLVPEFLSLIALIFSYTLRRRKKTVLVVECLATISLLCQCAGLWLWKLSYAQIDQIVHNGHWIFAGGHKNIHVSVVCSAILLLLMFFFRQLVRQPYTDGDSDSEQSEDEDSISVPDDIPPEQIDFYIFTKMERRRILASSG